VDVFITIVKAQLERTIKMQEKYLDKRTTKIQH